MIPLRIPGGFFAEIDKLILKFMWNKRPRIGKTILKKNKVGRLTLPDFKTCNIKATIIKRV